MEYKVIRGQEESSKQASSSSFPFDWVLTQDGSLTLKPHGKNSEWMHSLAGAYSETQYIYGQTLRKVLSNWPSDQKVQILSLGLGLGYVEVLCAVESLRHQVPFSITTYESEKSLIDFFQSHWDFKGFSLDSMSENSDFTSMFSPQIQDESLNSLCSHFRSFVGTVNSGMDTGFWAFFISQYGQDHVLKALELLKQNHIFRGVLDSKELNPERGEFCCRNIVFYDAYSSKTHPELWEESFLDQFIQKFCDSQCAFSSYAKVGSLNRMLKKHGFVMDKKSLGFASKRQSTRAFRGLKNL